MAESAADTNECAGKGSTKEEEDEDKDKESSNFECNICFDTAKDAVISMCGHLFCWPCLHQWLETRPNKKMCPVCKAAISKEKVIPLYGRGASSQEDPREKLPPRPPGQRTEPENDRGFMNGFGLGEGGFQFHFGIGAFPFGLFTTFGNFGGGGMAGGNMGPELERVLPVVISKILLIMAILFFWQMLFS